MWLNILFLACSSKPQDSASNFTADPRPWQSAPLVSLSSGECPNMSVSGETVSFLSSGESRNVTVVIPSSPQADMRVVFFYHGLMDPGYTPNPTGYMSTALNFQALADEYNALIFLPESRVWSMAGMQFFMWDIEEGTSENDLTLFDDLRTCAAQAFEVDLDALVSVGFSGGSLFNTVLYSQRSDSLAAVVEMSGGADVNIPLYDNPFAPYDTPSHSPPLLLISGGEADLWPDASFTLVNFETATDVLQANVLEDGGFAVRCKHNSGHTITNKAFEVSLSWMTEHRFGDPSPYENDIGTWSDWCEIP
ncbi:MAG: hypothetical protein VXZ96_07940 [Myxococcota bacterium]|nr:hypothetical protein [Myxococcota bacterium]